VNVVVTDGGVEVRLTPLEKALAVYGDISLPWSAIESAEVDPDPLRRMGVGWTAVGLRLPGVRFLCTTGWGRGFWSIRRMPALRLRVRQGRLREVTVSVPDAASLAEQLAARAGQSG
jgi:hypothetical protein